jgi:hypothetical protein
MLRTRGREALILQLAPFGAATDELLPPVGAAPPLVWIGGAEPLEYPEVSKFANAIAASGREVFLQTDGRLFRRRVHEFQPSPRFRLAFHFSGASVDATENAEVVEAIRIAKLSGFLTVGFTSLVDSNDLEKLIALHSQLKKLDLDGSLIFAAAATPELNRAVAAARRRLLDGRWSNLSRIFNSAALPGEALAGDPAASPSASPSPSASRRQVGQPTGQPAATDLDLDEGAQA